MTKRHLVITTGDPDGIGLEVCLKALRQVKPRPGVLFSVFLSKKQLPLAKRSFRLAGWDFETFSSLQDSISSLRGGRARSQVLHLIGSDLSAPHWVLEAGLACRHGLCDGMVTGPLSKTLIQKSGVGKMGHTEILKKISGAKNVFMGFIGKECAVVLAGGHHPLRSAPSRLNEKTLRLATQEALGLRALLPRVKQRLPVGVLGLNPHAGEGGLIGSEDQKIQRWIKSWKLGKNVRGPLVPDAAFTPESRRSHSVFVALYHDQGLIPFKALHGQEGGAHLSLGLPFVRTSVDHGTAKDIAGQGKADEGSMTDAILLCLKMLKQRGQNV